MREFQVTLMVYICTDGGRAAPCSEDSQLSDCDCSCSQVKQVEVLTKRQEERNKAFIPPKEKPLMKKMAKGRNEGRKWLSAEAPVTAPVTADLTCDSTSPSCSSV